ncbi:eIF-2-alpha kinase activator GCN1-like isoform X2 [Dendroctonus ponderosae]|uniref:eIF-2-alpha kinase activator GCN1 isoform X2 n=1 Tax=Dendroctonus ponderosae TaxID=77166 RepID=UPI00203516A1|nr:eIF-2-alpha kinase activator GCN1 isoform X2 [Dendroctonus ponderosae]XP_048524700.1 eIF-2-alpha kinase activator GCN1-like isoform X2 [Dendroctonus ponderosae]KAH1001345.1 hypothetical protein HUJ05_013390 [Dendroctonus ponderosae]KAH1001352.1 hypothetical protein HUJ05_009545 [Dendroctonus ponderosae]
MESAEVERVIKDLETKIQTSSLKKRKQVIDSLIHVAKNHDITEDLIRRLCKVVPITLHRYRDDTSRAFVRGFVKFLLTRYPEFSVETLTAELANVADQFKKLAVSDNVSHTALCALEWSTIIFKNGWIIQKRLIYDNLCGLLQTQAVFLTCVVAGGDRKTIQKAYDLLNDSWPGDFKGDTACFTMLKLMNQSPCVAVMQAVMIKRHSDKDNDVVSESIGKCLETLIKVFISVKIPPPANVLKACYPTLAEVKLNLFNRLVLPALQKAMLRNPERILETVGLVLAGVNLDLSSCAMEIGSSLITNLHSKDENARLHSAAGCKYLAEKISEPKAIEELLRRTFDVYNGSNGKLTVAEHKMGVLQGAANFSYNNVAAENLPALISKAMTHFIKVLDSEGHEKTLCFTLEMMSFWTSKISEEVPKDLMDIFKKGPSLKSSTPLVKISYIQCMLKTFNLKTMLQASDLIPTLLKSVEKAAAQPIQPNSVSEGLCASLLLIGISKAKLEKENGLSNMWNTVLDMDKQLFVADKFLQNASENMLPYVAELCINLLVEYPNKIGNKIEPLLKAIIHCALYPKAETRLKSLSKVKAISAGSKGTQIKIALLTQLEVLLSNNKISFSKDNSDNNIVSTAHALSGFITTLCSAVGVSAGDAHSLVISAILPCHYPLVFDRTPKLWVKITKYLKLNPKMLVAQRAPELKKKLLDNYKECQTYENSLSTLMSLNPEVILPDLLSKLKQGLQDPRISQITKDDYFTFLTPDGELYDKSVIPGDDSNDEMNLKRESKAYSYKEQLEEMQLRRELAEKKKKKDGKVKFTPKQLEAIKNQTIKEEGIRNKLTELNEVISKSISLVKAAAKGNPVELSLHYKDLLPLILHNLQSPLAAPHLTKLFLELSKTVFPPDMKILGELIGIITIRLCKPQCDLDANWEEEPISRMMVRVLGLIHDKTVPKKTEEKNQKIACLSAPAFSYTFPFVKYSLTSNYAKDHQDFITTGLQFISEHAKVRGSSVGRNLNIYHPKYLPTKQMFLLLVDIICNSSGRVQAQSEACLLDIANSVSGNPGCAKATLDEIDVLLSALQSKVDVGRDAALRALLIIVSSLPTFEDDYEYALRLNKRVWISRFDQVHENRILAEKLWIQARMEFPASLSTELMADIEHPIESVQTSAGKALAALLENDRDQVQPTINSLLKLYNDRLKMTPAKLDEFGREIEKAVDTWDPRRGVAVAIAELAPLITPDVVSNLIHFFVFSSLSDRSETVRKEMLNAALRIVDLHGKERVGTLWPVFDEFMGKSSKSANFDAVKQAVVVLMGCLARHLEKDDARIKPIFSRLIQALSTPSQTVQEAVANCLPPLATCVRDEAPGYINKLLHQLLKGDKYGERKGAAYGLAGIIKGLGILALKQNDIMSKLTDAVQDKKNYKHREGALFAFEMLFQMLGKLFEPYIVHVLPHLLQCFGDTSQYVRDAAHDTSRVVMGKLSGHGVKLVLPSLLEALEEDSWRTKTGSVDLLGTMAFCAPKQLSSCLPSIVPKLIEVLSDSHMKVQESGAKALKVIGSVIRNPEIQAIVPVLLRALQDPSNKTSVCLQTLLDTKFVHFIDAPSLALIMPVVQRAFMDRSTETRKMAAQIIGNMYSLTDQKDLMPYLPTIIPGLKTSLLDPVPEVRSVSARALGAMVRGMGETTFEDLLPWLMKTLTSESSSVDRSGAAQGLSEVVGGLGVEKLHKLMPDIINTAERTDIAPHVKDGYIMMFIYMPSVFTPEFTQYIGQIINPILKALADENEYVRETALKAGQRIVNLYAESAILLLLPELEKGLFDENWRIRYSSVQLLGDLLYRISGVTGKMSTETASEDDNFGTEQSHLAIINALGRETRNRVLAGLYMGRSDVALMVRQAALHVWKVVVTNTPRTLKEILPTLFNLLLGCLASDSYDKRQVAARTLGDLVRKLGERVLPEIIPILEEGLESERADQRQGVCIGLSEIMASTSKDMVYTFVNSLVPTVRRALCDPLPEVRQAAAKTFDSLHSTVGSRALDDILPNLLSQLNDDDPAVVECTLDGLRQVMAIKSRVVLPYLVPQLTAPPANTKALSILASVAGEALNKYLPRILPALQKALATSKGTPEEAQELEYCQAVILSVVDDVGIRTVIDTMLQNTKTEDADQRRAAATLLCAFCANSKAQYAAHVPQLLRGLIFLMTDNDRDVLQRAWEALNAVTKTLEPKQQAAYVSDVRQAVRYAMSDLKGISDLLPGFCLPKGIVPILPIFREAILNGDGDEKDAAAQGLGEIIRVTNSTALQPSVVAITGPLIRILGDRFGANVKTAVLETLATLLSKVGSMLKQFLPQLQTTFLKALNDPSRTVRLKSAAALGELIPIHQRADPLFTELHNSIKNNEDAAVKETTLHALRGIITPAGDKMSEPIKKQIHATLLTNLGQSEENVRKCAAGCLGAICKYLSPEQLDATLSEHLLNDDASANMTLREGRGFALTVALKEAPERLWDEQYKMKLSQVLLSQFQSQVVSITQSAIRSCGYLLEYIISNGEAIPNNVLVAFVRTMNNTNNEVKQLLARVLFHLAKIIPTEKFTSDFLRLVLPTLVNGTKEKNVYVKANSEIALIAILKLKNGDSVFLKMSNSLDIGARESLSDVVNKVLKKMLHQPEGKDEDIDDTLLT